MQSELNSVPSLRCRPVSGAAPVRFSVRARRPPMWPRVFGHDLPARAGGGALVLPLHDLGPRSPKIVGWEIHEADHLDHGVSLISAPRATAATRMTSNL